MKIINALSVFDIKVKLIDGKWILLSRVVSPDYARLKNDYAAKDYTYITKDSYTTTETIINDDYLKLEDSLAALQAKIDGLSESLMNDRFELFKLQASVNESSDDVNNTTKVASTESNNPTSNVSQTDWSGYFSNSGTGSNSSLTTNFTGLETSNNAQSKIVSGVNTTLIIESRIDSSGDGVDYRSLTVDTDTNDHYGANRFTNVNDSSNGSYTYTGWGEWNGSATITSTFGGSTQTSTITHGHWVAGNETSSTSMPRTGSASYIGSVVGDLQRNGSIISGGVNGTIGLDMNFTNGNFIGTMNLNDSNGAWASPRMSGEIDVNDADFRATSMSGVNRGDLRGNFYGPGAQEVGGAWNIENNNGENASGVFRAK